MQPTDDDPAEWRSVVLLGSSIPPMMSCIEEGTVGEIERREWELWEEIRISGLSRPLVFGDYTIPVPNAARERRPVDAS